MRALAAASCRVGAPASHVPCSPRIARASTTTQQQQQRQWQFRHRRRRRQCRLAGAAAEGEATPLQSEQQQQQTHTPGQPWIATAALRKVTAAGDANEALDVLCAECPALGLLSEAQCLELMLACLDRGNAALALSMFRSMSAAAGGAAASPAASLLSSLDGDAGSSSSAAALRWPPASVATGARLVVGLARVLETRAAIGLINSVRARGLASTEDVCFGHVVGCPQDRWVGGVCVWGVCGGCVCGGCGGAASESLVSGGWVGGWVGR